jgi:DNA-3-methyladenine glycosylase
MNLNFNDKLPRDFYKRDLLLVAKELLGKILVKKNDSTIYSGRIVEVEAYDGEIDEAAHTFKGKTPRNEIMFEEGGYFYVYFTYGAHFCCNVVTGFKGKGTAVLIRAVEPLTGIDQMSLNRFGKKDLSEKEKYNLTSGPGKVCQAFKITKEHYGLDLTGEKVFLLNAPSINTAEIQTASRIGITRSVDLPWRFYLSNNRYVSRK